MEDENVRIKRCCASCAFKQLTRTTLRYCSLQDKLVMSSEVCENWQISRLLKGIQKRVQGV